MKRPISTIYHEPAAEDVSSSRSTTTAAVTAQPHVQRFRLAPFILALGCFLLPFIKLSCAIDPSRSIGIHGAKFVFGGEVASSIGKGDKIEPHPWAIAGFALTVAGLVAAVAARGAVASGFSVAAFIALF